METQACTLGMWRFKTSSANLRNWLESRKQAGFTFVSLVLPKSPQGQCEVGSESDPVFKS